MFSFKRKTSAPVIADEAKIILQDMRDKVS